MQYLENDQFNELLDELSNSASSNEFHARHGSMLTIASILRQNPSMFCACPLFSKIVDCLKDASNDDKVLLICILNV